MLENYCRTCSQMFEQYLPSCPKCTHLSPQQLAAARRDWTFAQRESLLANMGVPPAFVRCGFDTFEARTPDQHRALTALQAWADGGCRLGLYLHGPVGTGKTHLAIGALLEVFAQRRARGRYASAREVVLSLREAYSGSAGATSVGETIAKCSAPHVDVLVLDDVAAGKNTEFITQSFDVLVDRAYSQHRPLLIVTSNLELTQLGRRTDERIADRLRELCTEVRVGGISYRRKRRAPTLTQGAGQISKVLTS